MRIFLKNTLPPELIKLINLDSIHYETDTHIDSTLHKNISDLVIKTQTSTEEKPVDIYFLFEHKSVYDDKIIFQILRYMLTMWEKDLKKGVNPRIIIPFVFYHGKKEWKIRKLSELFTTEKSIQKWMIDVPYLIFDTGKSTADFSEAIKLKISVEMLKKAFIKNRAEIIEILELISNSGILEKEDFSVELIYLFETSDLDKEEFMDIIRTDLRISKKSEVKMTSLAERLRMEGKQEGRAEGAYSKAVETCKQALLAGIVPETVAKITGLPLEKVLEIQKSCLN